MADLLTIRVPGDGVLLVDPQGPGFEGDSALVEPLRLLTLSHRGGYQETPGGEWLFAVWSGPGGARRALETVEPRFADEWRHLLPTRIADAELPIFEPVHQAEPGVVY